MFIAVGVLEQISDMAGTEAAFRMAVRASVDGEREGPKVQKNWRSGIPSLIYTKSLPQEKTPVFLAVRVIEQILCEYEQ